MSPATLAHFLWSDFYSWITRPKMANLWYVWMSKTNWDTRHFTKPHNKDI